MATAKIVSFNGDEPSGKAWQISVNDSRPEWIDLLLANDTLELVCSEQSTIQYKGHAYDGNIIIGTEGDWIICRGDFNVYICPREEFFKRWIIVPEKTKEEEELALLQSIAESLCSTEETIGKAVRTFSETLKVASKGLSNALSDISGRLKAISDVPATTKDKEE